MMLIWRMPLMLPAASVGHSLRRVTGGPTGVLTCPSTAPSDATGKLPSGAFGL